MNRREQCPACGGLESVSRAKLPYNQPPLTDYLRTFYRNYPHCDFTPLAGEVYQLDECGRCGCHYQNPVPGDDFLARFYGQGLYGAGTQEIGQICEPYQTEQAIRELMMVVRFLNPTCPRPCLLDFGTGNGNWAILAGAAGLDTHASDLSPHAFDRLRTRGVTCHLHATLPQDQFDFINTEQVFEHLIDPIGQLQVLAQSLRPGGIIKIGVPYDPQLRAKLKAPDWTAPKNSAASLNGVAPLEHLNHFEPSSLDALAARCGLEPLVIKGWELVSRRQAARAQPLLQKIGRWLRHRLGEIYRPHHRLTQTRFFQKTNSA